MLEGSYLPVKDGLAGYMRSPISFVLKAAIFVFLLPFWLTSEIRQARWHIVGKVFAIGTVWILFLSLSAVGSGESARRGVLDGIGAGTARDVAEVDPGRSDTEPSESMGTAEGSTESDAVGETSALPIEGPGAPGDLPNDPELDQLRVEAEHARAGYDRDLFRHWIDADGDGCDTRREVLIDESLVNATTSSGCAVSGRWFSNYDGVTTTTPSTFDVDHFIPLAEAWDSGADAWPSDRRRQFANDLGYGGSLIAVSASSNRSKSDRDIAEWLPVRREYHCIYADTWIEVKARWDLSVDSSEFAALRSLLSQCGETESSGSSGSGSSDAPADAPPDPPPPSPSTVPPPSSAPSEICGAPTNPWGYNFCGGGTIANPPSNFCSYFKCIGSFWDGVGYVVECEDAMYSKSGGRQGVCSQHGGDRRTLNPA